MFFFLFFYTVAYLSGVSASTKLLLHEVALAETTNTTNTKDDGYYADEGYAAADDDDFPIDKEVFEGILMNVLGGILLPLYVLVPLWKLRSGAAYVKAAVKEAASEEGHTYEDIKAELDSNEEGTEIYKNVASATKVIGGGEVSTYRDSLGVFSKKATESKINEHRTRRSSGGGKSC
ncbi:hypothetical protein TrLO_g4737 [Triparma laevis f. longispina]|uniref:Uncharacterized protein n=1 Tax=Triparma laevis f. longispina TaxID=1714387 RepID=A0A9W7KRC8_9STRA|nr:hypothetical protein TrLO_g4737 [Triparma laevis f. longispina]